MTTARDIQERCKGYAPKANHDFARDDGGFAIYCRGHYTIAELEWKIAELKAANEYFRIMKQPIRPR